VVVGFVSTRIVDLEHEFHCLGIREVEEVVNQSRDS
jgi:hypothetical protein